MKIYQLLFIIIHLIVDYKAYMSVKKSKHEKWYDRGFLADLAYFWFFVNAALLGLFIIAVLIIIMQCIDWSWLNAEL